MSPADARASQLAAECRRDWFAVKQHLVRALGADAAAGDAPAALVALSLDHAYQAFETMLLRIERGVGLQEREGAAWHSSLLADAALELPGVRPALVVPETLGDWDALLRFRHFLRHAYVVQLDPERLRANVVRLERAVAASDVWMDAVLAALAERDASA